MPITRPTLGKYLVGMVASLLIFLAGGWLILAPFALTTQPSGQPWIASTINSVTIGGVLLVVSLFGILVYLVLALRDLLRETQAKEEADQEAPCS